MTTQIEILAVAAADGWINAGDEDPGLQARLLLTERHHGWLPLEEDLLTDEGERISADSEPEFAAAFWGRIEEVAR